MNKPLKISKSGLILPSDQEEAAIARGIAQDADTMEVTPEVMTKMVRRRGRPHVANPKEPATLRLDGDLLQGLRESGSGWQTRVNEVLRQAWERGEFKHV